MLNIDIKYFPYYFHFYFPVTLILRMLTILVTNKSQSVIICIYCEYQNLYIYYFTWHM